MSFGIALSGLDAAQNDLNVTANNIANSQTTGFKSSRSDFAELYANSTTAAKTQIGNGVQLQQIEQSFGQGDVETTGNSLDLALSGSGFFVVSQGGAQQFTRAGNFQTDNKGNVVNGNGQNLQVYAPNANGTFNTTSLTNLQLPTGNSPPLATTTGALDFNLPANATPPTTTPFDPTDPNTYTQSTSMTVYDSLGAAHTASFYFANSGANTWNAYEYIDNVAVNPTAPAATAPTPVQMTFTNTGTLSAVTDNSGAAAGAANPDAIVFGPYTPTTGAAPMNITYNLADATQFGQTFGVTSVTQDGYTTGQISGVSVSDTGVVQANYTNGQSKNLGQVAVATFANQQGLQQVQDTNWVQTFASGQPVFSQAGSAGVGNIQAGALEQSNVDITAQLVNMITAQRAFQANSEMISTDNSITQTIINIPNQG
jgi:flagellar hook protein FlgE